MGFHPGVVIQPGSRCSGFVLEFCSNPVLDVLVTRGSAGSDAASGLDSGSPRASV